MGEKTGISWTDHTFNPWIGCAKVSAGCVHCYAERDNYFHKWVPAWGVNTPRKRTSESTWKNPLKWDKAAKCDGVRRKVFCASLADVFEDRPELVEWRKDLFHLILLTPYLDWLLLTKRPENVTRMTVQATTWRQLPATVWIGTTAENQEMADKRIPELLKIQASVRFLSVEPMLGPVNLGLLGTVPKDISQQYRPVSDMINWVICGGESGPGARPMNLDWARDLREECQVANVPFFFKQVGGTARIDAHWGGELLDDVRFQEFPK